MYYYGLLTGFFSGIAITITLIIVLAIRTKNWSDANERNSDMEAAESESKEGSKIRLSEKREN